MKTVFLAAILFFTGRSFSQDSTFFRLHDVYGAVNNTYFLDYFKDTKGQFGFTGGFNFIGYRLPFERQHFFQRVDGFVGAEYNYAHFTKSPVAGGSSVYYTDMHYTMQTIAPAITARLYFGKKARWHLYGGSMFHFRVKSWKTGTIHSTAYDANNQPYSLQTPVSERLDSDLLLFSAFYGIGVDIPIGTHALTLNASYNMIDYRDHLYDLGNQLKFSNLRVGVGFRF